MNRPLATLKTVLLPSDLADSLAHFPAGCAAPIHHVPEARGSDESLSFRNP